MILEQQKDAVVLQQGDVTTIEMSLDLESQQVLMMMLSKNLYSDEIGSTVRELASNALDSHRRAGVDKPIVVSLKQNAQYNWEFTVEDFGVGLDSDDIRDIISKYGKSLAREEVNSLGAMGLGFKSPLSYTSSFYFIGRKSGVERKWTMYEGEEKNSIDMLSEEPTTEPDGVKVIVPVKFSSKDDFVRKIKEQLAYFEGVYFDGPNLRNDFTIYRGEHFQWSQLSSDTSLHLCLDNVYYPIDFAKLGISRINFPLALRFSLRDGIFPVPNRESLRYTPEAKQKILDKLKLVATYFVDKFNESIGEVEDVQTVFDYYSGSVRNVVLEGRVFDVAQIKKYSENTIAQPKLKGVKYIRLDVLNNMKDHILGEYCIKYNVTRYKMSEDKGTSDVKVKHLAHCNYFVYNDKISGNMREYLKTLVMGETKIIKKVAPFKLGNSRSLLPNNYYRILGLNSYPKHLWRKVITEFQMIQKSYTSQFKDIDEIVIPKDWLERKKKVRVSSYTTRRVKLSGEITCKQAAELEKSMSNRNCKFVATTLKLEELHKFKGLTVYTHHDDFLKLDPLYSASRRKHRMRFLTFSDRELKIVNPLDIHNLISYKKFMEGNNMMFKRIVTAYLIDQLISSNSAVFEKRAIFADISKDLHDKLEKLKEYKGNNYAYGSLQLYTAMLEVAVPNKLFDPSIYSEYVEIKELLAKLTFINPILKTVSTTYSYSKENVMSKEEGVSILCDLFKHYKYRIDHHNYKSVKEDEEPLQEEDLTDEDVKSLVDMEESILEEEES